MVVGTVIDPDIGDELRVTVVATGLNGSGTRRQAMEPPLQVVRNGTTGEVESDAVSEGTSSQYTPPSTQAKPEPRDMFDNDLEDIEYLDIPAFLRRQAD